MNIEQVLNDHHDRLMAIPGVTGMGIGSKDGKPAIVIMVKQLTSDMEARLPSFFRSTRTQMFNGYADQVASLYKGMDLRKNY